MLHRVPLFLAAAALALFAGATLRADDQGKQGRRTETHEGKVVSATGGRLVMTDRDGKEHTHLLAPDAKVMLDGKTATAEDLKPGMRIRVTTPRNDMRTAIRVDALDRNKDFPRGDLNDRNRR